MLFTSPALAEDVAWGKPVKGVRLGLAVVPSSGPLPTELELEALAQNTTSAPQQLPAQACNTVLWTSFTLLHVRTANGRVFSYPIGAQGDVTNLHPHGPVNLAPGETLRERFSLKHVVKRPTENPGDAELWTLLETPRQVELWVEFVGDSGAPRIRSGHLKHRLGLPPAKVPMQEKRCVSQIAAGGSTACALLRDGTPWCWGAHPPGARGIGEDAPASRGPSPLPLLAGSTVELGVELDIACMRTSTGAAYCAGGNLDASEAAYGEPGGHPVRVQHLEGATALDGAQCARVADGSLACWSLLGPPPPTPEGLVALRWEESAPGVVQVARGGGFTCALRRDGALWCWGANESGQLGTGADTPQPGPTRVSGLPQEVISVAAGTSHACAALRDGSLWCWGRSEYGALGLGDARTRSVPAPVPGMSEVVRVAAGEQKTCAWKKDGSLWCFGDLLLDPPFPALTRVPVEMKGLDHPVEEVVFGFRHTCARTTGGGAGNVFCWGENTEGQSGSSELRTQSPVVRVPLPGQAVALTAGEAFTCAITTDGSAWCWGRGTGGQLGTKRTSSSARPVRVRLPCPG
ncbi:RCC1 domain-containing protein [Corallococcus carmarthensis]|uniref:RCC1 domain-containing protein n=1 Tax=Corallococcus carmarthensis TaxID=2316728 RepID=UPI00148C14B7|nr:RCC1 domain-containing protein [Corallococcus carmarthensis]NOK15904.1 hypothetical protein [Corallococcus carmarthensis]